MTPRRWGLVPAGGPMRRRLPRASKPGRGWARVPALGRLRARRRLGRAPARPAMLPWMPLWAALAPAAAGFPATAEAQDAAQPPPEAVPVPAADRPSPAGAFLRGTLVPGWGHTVSGAHARGAFYFAAESLSGWMLFKTVRRLGAARRALSVSEREATARLEAMGVTGLDDIEAALEEDEDVSRTRGLVAAREEQREDWLAVAIFTLLVSGVDAFVSAHLQNYPEPLVEPAPGGAGLVLGLRVPLG